MLGVDSMFDIDMEDLKEKACAVVGREMGEMYYDYMSNEKKKYEKKLKPMTSKFFEGEITSGIDTDVYKCGEATKDIESYVIKNIRRRDVLSDPMIGEKFLTMAENMHRLYAKEVMSTDLKVLHNKIVRNIYKIRSKDEDSRPVFLALKPYLKFVSDTYDVSLITPIS